jgi:predicted outer membrane protein
MKYRCALALCAVAACASQGTEAAEHTDSTGRRDSIAAVAAASMNEPQVLGLLEHVHVSDGQLGALGGKSGSTLDIRNFGLMIQREHQALERDVREVAEGLRLTPARPVVAPDAAPATFRANVDSSPGGAPWDLAYVEYTIAAHEASLENMARALAATKSPAVRENIRKSVPILQKHLDKARSLQQSLVKAQPARGSSSPAPR